MERGLSGFIVVLFYFVDSRWGTVTMDGVILGDKRDRETGDRIYGQKNSRGLLFCRCSGFQPFLPEIGANSLNLKRKQLIKSSQDCFSWI